jgi:hypothetical protein
MLSITWLTRAHRSRNQHRSLSGNLYGRRQHSESGQLCGGGFGNGDYERMDMSDKPKLTEDDLYDMQWDKESAEEWDTFFLAHGINRSEVIRQALEPFTHSRWHNFKRWLRSLAQVREN